MQTVTITTDNDNNTTYSTYTRVELAGGLPGASSASSHVTPQLLRIGATTNNSGGTVANCRFVLYDAVAAVVYKHVDLTLTVTGVVSSGSNYLMTVAATTNDFLDLTGYEPEPGNRGKQWYVGIAGEIAGSGTSCTLYLWPTRAV